MRTLLAASALTLILAQGLGSPLARADPASEQAQVRALETQIEQLVERVCALQALVETLQAERVSCVQAGSISPAATGEQAQPESDRWCDNRAQTREP